MKKRSFLKTSGVFAVMFLCCLLAVSNRTASVVTTAQTSETVETKSHFAPAVCPGAGLLISEVFPNPSGGTDSPFEFIELVATRSIDFATTPHSVVFVSEGPATGNGWREGGDITYGFNITTGTVAAGDVVYVGGSAMTPTGTKLRTINTGTTGGDAFGNADTTGVLGNGGGNADGVAVFSVAVTAVTDSTVPVDAIFYGTSLGNAVVAGGTDGYVLPSNDRYSGGFLQTSSFLAADPGNSSLIAAGTFNTVTCTFSTARDWTAGANTDSVSAVTLSAAVGAPTISENTASPFLSLPATGAGAASGVINDQTDPARTLGVDFTITDSDTPIGSLTVTATSSNTAVVPAANLNLTGAGATRNLKITPAAVGYSNITVTVSDGASTGTYVINYAASDAPNTPATTKFHTGKADASTAIAVDTNYMFVADDEDQILRLYDRNNSGLPVNSFDFTASLALPEAGREADIEASAQIGNRIFWLASHSNSSTGESRPNRSRLFATDISGTGATATLAYVGRFDNLKANLVSWDVNNLHGLGANFFGLSVSAAPPKIPETGDGSGFNIEGLTIAPDGTSGYISFRAPIVPANARTKALIVPVLNIASLVTGNPTGGTATFGAPIQLNLGGRGIREIKKNAANEYLIIAGPPDSSTGFAPKDFLLYTWTGNAGDAPIRRGNNLTPLNTGGSFESIVEVPSPLGFGNFLAASVQLLTDNGDTVFYNDGTAAKELANAAHKKFRSDIVMLAVPNAASVTIGGRVTNSIGRAIAGERVKLTASTGASRVVRTNPFGYYRFEDISAGQTVTVEVFSKRYEFAPQILDVTEAVENLNFTAMP